MRLRYLTFCCLISFAASDVPRSQSHTLAYEFMETSAAPVPFAGLTSVPPAVDVTAASTARSIHSRIEVYPAYTIESYSTPGVTAKSDAPLLRIGLLEGNKLVGSTTLTSLSALQKPDESILKILLDGQGRIFGVSWHNDPLSISHEMSKTPQSKAKREKGHPRLLVVNSAPEPRPHLNKPVVLNEHGKVEEPEQPKTLLQKYWWVGAALLVMTLAGGGNE